MFNAFKITIADMEKHLKINIEGILIYSEKKRI